MPYRKGLVVLKGELYTPSLETEHLQEPELRPFQTAFIGLCREKRFYDRKSDHSRLTPFDFIAWNYANFITLTVFIRAEKAGCYRFGPIRPCLAL